MRSKWNSRRVWLAGTALAAVLAGTAAAAESSQAQFAIAPGDLGSALGAYAKQAGVELFYQSRTVAGRKTPGLNGAYAPDEALAMLLAGTDLVVAHDPSGVLIVREAAQAPQGGSAAGDGATVEALIVTAQKREENIQDVPIAMSAFSQESLERHQIAGGPDLITQVPNMTFTKTNFSSYSIQIRGIGTQAISATTDPGVAVAFNNTPFIRNRFFEQEFYDLQRVEVLRGPQGTLYGRNATAGVVNIISQKPKFFYEAKASGDLANYNSTRVEGMVNIPLVEDAAALRLAGAWTKRDGYAFNELSGNPIDGRDLWSTRLSLRFAPIDSPVDVNLLWEHFEEEDDRLRSGKQLCKKDIVTHVGDNPVQPFDMLFPGTVPASPFASIQSLMSQGCERVSLYSPDAFQTPNGAMVPYYVPLGSLSLPTAFFDPYASTVQARDLRVIESTVDPKYRAKSDLGELQVNWDITDGLTLASETAYSADFVWSMQDFNRFNTAPGAWSTSQNLINAQILDEDGFFIDPQVGRADRLVAIDLSTGKSRQFSQELRLSSDFEGPFNFSLGANFLRFDGEDKYYVFINSLTMVSFINSRLLMVQLGDDPDAILWEPVASGVPGASLIRGCEEGGVAAPGDPSGNTEYGYRCVSIEPNSIENIQDYGHNYFLSRNPYRLISYAMFGEAYYNVTENLKITGGLRWTVDKKHAPRIPSWTLVGFGTIGYPVREIIDQEWREPTGRLAIDWKPDLAFTDETLLYASYGHGYKAGGANPPPMMLTATGRFGGTHASITRPKTFDAEFIDAFELGAKNTLADGRVTLNLAAFYYDYKDYQISEIVDRSAFNRNFDATIWGIEIEADWRPLENLKFGFKGGYENTRIADGEAAIDLMERNAGHGPGSDDPWVILRPFPTSASSCVLPLRLFLNASGGLKSGGLGNVAGGGAGGCELAYLEGVDPVTQNPYDPDNPSGGRPGHLGFDPFDESQGHNFGEGFAKQLGGNELPNAPNFTATLTVDYTVPLAGDWLATLHSDLYWQSDSWWRVFNDHEFNRLDEYFTTNLAAIFTNEDAGWKVMAYVKNVFDRDSITGAFLNSDDTGLTTNVFLTEPRLYGLRVTKEWRGGPLLGSFGEWREGPYPFTVELGGQVQRHEAPNAALTPSFMDSFSEALNPLAEQQEDLDWGDGRSVKLTYRPEQTWNISLGARFGKTNGAVPLSARREEADRACFNLLPRCQPGGDSFYVTRDDYTMSTTVDREEHTVIDFEVGRDIGVGGLAHSTLSAGLRYADLQSVTRVDIVGKTNWDIPVEENLGKYNGLATHDRYVSELHADREFSGLGPTVSWAASAGLLGGDRTGVLSLDWTLSAGVLFGTRETSVVGEEVKEDYSQLARSMSAQGAGLPDLVTELPPVSFHRSEDVTVPVFGASLGLSYRVNRVSLGAGYRWERYQDAIDGGFSETQEEDRTIDGPYFKLSVGFGGS